MGGVHEGELVPLREEWSFCDTLKETAHYAPFPVFIAYSAVTTIFVMLPLFVS